MTAKRRVKNFIERLTGIHIFHTLPHGVDLFEDIASRLPLLKVKIIFDVGANIGQSAKKYSKQFPDSEIYSFEPVRATFYRLKRNSVNNNHIHCACLALGAREGKQEMTVRVPDDMCSFIGEEEVASESDRSTFEIVNTETLDRFCGHQGITHISYLKIDTEGGELAVLKGSQGLLGKQAIDLVEVEAGMNRRNERHVPFEWLKQYLEMRGYYLFGIYEQVNEWPTREPQLRRANSVFVSQSTIRVNTAKENAAWQP